MIRFRRGGLNLLYYSAAMLVFILDQASKWWVVHHMKLYESYSVLGDFFHITSSRNQGAAFSILQGARWFFVIVTLVVTFAIVWYLRRMISEKRRLMSIALSLLLGGALGNLFGRALRGEVVDFLSLHFKFHLFGLAVDYYFAIFNLADCAITISVVLILLDMLFVGVKERRGAKNDTSGNGKLE